jgi:hypothetical protein
MINTIKKHLKIKGRVQTFTFSKDKVRNEGDKFMGELPGVYWLMKGKTVVYIGTSGKVMNRLKSHMGNSSKIDWDISNFVIVEDRTIRRDLEYALIRTIPTKYNNPKSVKGTKDTEKYFYYKMSDYRSTIRLINDFKEMGLSGNFITLYEKLPLYESLVKMSYEEWLVEYNKKLNGEPHRLI